MSTIDAITLLDSASITLQDTGKVRWANTELLGYLNLGQREIAGIRPECYIKNTTMQLVAGPKQSLPSDGARLVDIPYNLGLAGTKVGTLITRVDEETIRKRVPGWANAAANAVVKAYIYNEQDQVKFYVWPPQPATAAYIQIVYNAVPADVANFTAGTKLTLDDIYFNPLLEYVLYKAYGKETEQTYDEARSKAHYASMLTALNFQTAAETKKAAR